MRKLLVLALGLSLLVPSLALAGGKPGNPGKSQDPHGKAAPKVMYVLKGTVEAYTAAQGTTNGSITIKFTRANRHGAAFVKALNKADSSFVVTSSTKVVLHDGAAIATGDNVIVKLRGPKATADFLTAYNANQLSAFQVVDQGAPKS